jgi:hypothetical protein
MGDMELNRKQVDAILHQTNGVADNIKLKDSGERREPTATGSVRDKRDGKGRYDLLPGIALRLIARQYEEGAKKYGERNWEKGQPLSWYLDSAQRHGFNVSEGMTDEDHAVAAAWNWLGFIATREWIKQGKLPKELDDLSPEQHKAANAAISKLPAAGGFS